MPDGAEIQGSRRTWEEDRFLLGERIYVATTYNDSNIPAYGAGFRVPGGGSDETQPLGRMAVTRKVDPEAIPGIFLFRITYRGFRPYSY